MEAAAATAAAGKGRLARQLSSSTYERYIRLQGARRLLRRAWRAVRRAAARLVRTVAWLPCDSMPTMDDDDDDDILVPINAAKLVDELLDVHGHEVRTVSQSGRGNIGTRCAPVSQSVSQWYAAPTAGRERSAHHTGMRCSDHT